MTDVSGLDRVELAWGTGEGHTELGALDAALAAAGVGDYNLVRLSSVVPADCEVASVGTHERRFPVGQPVACVLADATASGGTASAGLGWALADEGGVFMEESAPDAATCREKLVAGVRDARARREWAWNEEIRTKVLEHDVEDCGAAVVAAVYAPVALRDV